MEEDIKLQSVEDLIKNIHAIYEENKKALIDEIKEDYIPKQVIRDKIEEIEELHLEKDYIINNSIDREIQNKINELVRAVNKLNKQDTSKENK